MHGKISGMTIDDWEDKKKRKARQKIDKTEVPYLNKLSTIQSGQQSSKSFTVNIQAKSYHSELTQVEENGHMQRRTKGT